MFIWYLYEHHNFIFFKKNPLAVPKTCLIMILDILKYFMKWSEWDIL